MIRLAKRGAQVSIEVLPSGPGGVRYRFITPHPTRADKDLHGTWRILERPVEQISKLISNNTSFPYDEIASKLKKLDSPEDFTEFQDDPDESRPRILYVYRNGNLWASTDPRLIVEMRFGGRIPR